MKKLIKDFYTDQVNSVTLPPFPLQKRRKNSFKDNYILAICSIAALVILYTPLSYKSEIREVKISKNVSVIIKDELTRGVLNSANYIQSRGDQNE